MSRKRLPPIDADLKDRFAEDVEERFGSTHGHLRSEVEKALVEYLEGSEGGDVHDKLDRIEAKLDEIAADAEEVGDPPSSDESGEWIDSFSPKTQYRLSDILTDIETQVEKRGMGPIREGDVETAIERNAGTSYKTIERYKDILTKNNQIIQHPFAEDTYFARPSAFIAFCHNSERIGEEELDRIMGQFPDGWWEEHAPEGLLESEDIGFY